jgi:hypothetical protein
MRRTGHVAIALAAFVLLSGCAAAPLSPAETTEYDCNGRPVSRAAFEERAPLSGSARTALAEAARADGREMDLSADAGWFTLTESVLQIEVLRALPELEDLENGEIPSDHEYLAVTLGDTEGGGRSWRTRSSSPCALRLDLGGSRGPTVVLAHAPDLASRDLDLLVSEHACTSGESAEGRIEVVSLEESADRVEVLLGVRPRGSGFASCQGVPGTPFTISLAEPLGDREVVDAGLVIPRAMTIATHPAF